MTTAIVPVVTTWEEVRALTHTGGVYVADLAKITGREDDATFEVAIYGGDKICDCYSLEKALTIAHLWAEHAK